MIRMTPILPKGKLFDAAKLQRAIDNGLDASAKGAQADFGVTTQTWSERPTFRIIKRPGEREVSTDDQRYAWVNDGTRPHIIRARNGPFLHFRTGGRPKTIPRRIRSYKGSAGKTWVRTKWVLHPGTFAREFTEVIHLKWQTQLPITLQRAINAQFDK